MDDPSRVQGVPFRLYSRSFTTNELSEQPILVVILHGDAPFNEPDRQYRFAAQVARSHRDVVAVALLDPGTPIPRGIDPKGSGDSPSVTTGTSRTRMREPRPLQSMGTLVK